MVYNYDQTLSNKVMYQALFLFFLLTYSHAQEPTSTTSEKQTKPNIIFIVADDLGWDDVSFHGSPQIPTPNIDTLALSGIMLNNYYVSPSSLGTKSEFMTGKYATKLGVQHGVLHNKQAAGLSSDEKILPQYLNEMGYKSHAVGKWGLGFYTEQMLPWKRGFESFYGGLTGSSADYFTHSAYDDNYGLDLRRNDQVINNETGHYITELYTREAVDIISNHDTSEPLFLYVSHQAVHSGNADDPLQVPKEYLDKVQHIQNPKRKLYAGMVTAVDESILNITRALSEKGMMNETIIIFTTDGGGAVGGMELNSGSNFPLRGSKLTVWEGGIRAVGFIYSDMIRENSRVNEEMFHSTDWLPTILSLAGGDWKSIKSLDGFNVWDAMTKDGVMSPRFEILHQFDPLQKNQCALRVGDYKLILNQDIGFYGDWYPRPASVGELQNITRPTTLPNAQVKCDKNYPHPFLEMHAPPCDSMKRPCLFNIQWDPCEFHNLAEFMPNTLKVLLDRLHFYKSKVKKPSYPKFDERADPENNDGVWGPWINKSQIVQTTSSPYVAMSTESMTTIQNPLQVDNSSESTGQKPTEFVSMQSTQPAPVLILTEKAINELPKWESELSNNHTVTTAAPLVFEPTIPLTDNKTVDPDEKQVNQFLDVVSDTGDKVNIAVHDHNSSKTSQHDFAHVGDEFVNAGEGNATTYVTDKTTQVSVTSNQTSENPTQTNAVVNDLHVVKGSTSDTSSIAEDTLSYSHNKEEMTENHHGVVYESGPIADILNATEPVSGNGTIPTPEVYGPYDSNYTVPYINSGIAANNTIDKAEATAAQAGQPALKPQAPLSPVASNQPIVPSEPVAPSVPLPPAMFQPPQGASLRPAKDKPQVANKPASESKFNVNTGSESISSSESEVGASTLTDSKTESKLPALQNAKTLATLNNYADAGDKSKRPGKQGLSSEVAVASGSDLGPGNIKAQNFIKEPKYAQVEKPDFEKPQNPFAGMGGNGERLSMGSSAGAGSETESETVVGAGAQTGSDTKIGQKEGPKLVADKLTPAAETKEQAVAKHQQGETSDVPVVAVDSIPKVDTFIKPNKPNLGSSLKALSSHSAADKGAEFSLIDEHIPVPNAVVAGHRPFQSVTDIVSDTISCGEGRSCVQHVQNASSPLAGGETPSVNAKPIEPFDGNKTLILGDQFESIHKYQSVTSGSIVKNNTQGTQATSNESEPTRIDVKNTTKDENFINTLPANEKLHKFFGQIKVDNKKMFYIAGAASEEKDLIYPPNDSSGLVTQNDVRKHNIGFNVMLPSNVVMKQLSSTSAPKFKEHTKFQNSTKGSKLKKLHADKSFVHAKNKTSIKKVFDMIADPARTRKTKVEIPPVLEEHEITSKTNIATVSTEDQHGDTGDIGATKPLKGTLIESKTTEVAKSVINNDTAPVLADSNSKEHVGNSNTEAGDLGSIVTLVGKVRVDRLNSKRTKHNITSDETNAHKKTVKDHNMSMKHMHNGTTETNAANIDQIAGPSNSIIVSSVIVVLIASFVVVGMAVVAIVAVVAKHCRVGKRFAAT